MKYKFIIIILFHFNAILKIGLAKKMLFFINEVKPDNIGINWSLIKE